MTNFEYITHMTIDCMAESLVKQMLVAVRSDCWMSLVDFTCYSTRGETIAHNKQWLLKETTFSI